jgi:hypothetical protein
MDYLLTLKDEERPIFFAFLLYHPTLLSLAFRVHKSIIDTLGDPALRYRDDEQAKADAAAFLVMLVLRDWVHPMKEFHPGICNKRIRSRNKDLRRDWLTANTHEVDADPAQFYGGKLKVRALKPQPQAKNYDSEGKDLNRTQNHDYVDLNTDRDWRPAEPGDIMATVWREVKIIAKTAITDDFDLDPYYHEDNKLAILNMFVFQKLEVKEIAEKLDMKWTKVKTTKDSILQRINTKMERDHDFRCRMAAWTDPERGYKLLGDSRIHQFAFEYQYALRRGEDLPGADRLREIWHQPE